ncbi:sodium-dependent transporter [Haladaptatus paucihalophilus DX253]|uniref:Sodium-dependent transporter n=2 Tax=Haladaptatus paucihalophilus TaxID=367189 RepID=E7QML2_HALPU|nr:sodium-dependent transporter [Haladaptatus paucihalophilus DX253]
MFDVGLQNSDLAVARFPALFSIWHDVNAPALASYFSQEDKATTGVSKPADRIDQGTVKYRE